MPNTSDFKDIFAGMFSDIAVRNLTAYEMVKDHSVVVEAKKALDAGNPFAFHRAVLHPVVRVIDGMLEEVVPSDYRAQFLFKHPQYIADHFETIISTYEGFSCRSDKAKTIVRAIALKLTQGTPICWNYDQEFTFHLPTKVFATEAAVLQFYDALIHLYLGNPSAYLVEMKSIIASQALP